MLRHPKLLIHSHYDSVINKVDLNIEKLKEKYNQNQNIDSYVRFRESEMENKIGYMEKDVNPFEFDISRFHYKLEENSKKLHIGEDSNEDVSEIEKAKNNPKSCTKVHHYLDEIRSVIINELKNAEKKTLEYYETIKSKIDTKSKRDSTEFAQEVYSKIFSNKFYFVLDVDQMTFIANLYNVRFKNKQFFNFRLFLTDSYLEYGLFRNVSNSKKH